MDAVRVGVVAAEMEGPSTGVGRYLQGLFTGLGSWQHGIEWHLFFQGAPNGREPEIEGCVLHHSNHRGSRVAWELLWLPPQLGRHRLDVVFSPAYTIPFGVRIPRVVSIHDLSFELLPEEFGFRERWRRRVLARRAARVAERVLTDTVGMAELVSRSYGVPAERMAVVPLGVDRARFGSLPEHGDRDRLEDLNVRAPYVLWLGTVLERRQPREVLEAVAAVRSRGHELQLVIAGSNRMRSPHRLAGWIRDLGLEACTRQLGWIGEEYLAPLYRGAAAAVYVSRHEGFGLPPLECLACGTPVVVAPGLALDTAWPDYPYRCEDTTAAAIEATLVRLVASGGWSSDQAAAAQRVVDHFNWEASSKLLVAVLEKAAAG
jgi:glycosyltransferase involved in cell wall biosynthesis